MRGPIVATVRRRFGSGVEALRSRFGRVIGPKHDESAGDAERSLDEESADPAGTSAQPDTDRTHQLLELRCVGPATAAILEESTIEAGDIIDRSVSFVRLVELGVDPGVAARIRRAYSLPWSDEPTSGARLRRRAEHVRHLGDDERSWIAESRAAVREAIPGRSSVTDGSGRLRDSERAWRERGRPSARATRTQSDAARTAGPALSGEVPTAAGPPIDPGEYTVAELEEVVSYIDDPRALAAVLATERDGDERKTAIEVIEYRMQAVGGGHIEPTVVGHVTAFAPGLGVLEGTNVSDRLAKVTRTGVDQLRRRVDESVARLRDSDGVVRRSVERYRSRTNAMEPDEWRLVSLAMLVGFISLGAMVSFVSAVQPAIGLPTAALPLLIVTTVVGVVSLALLWWEAPVGVELTIITGLVGLCFVGLVGIGVFGGSATAGPPIALSGLAAVSMALIGSTALSRAA